MPPDSEERTGPDRINKQLKSPPSGFLDFSYIQIHIKQSVDISFDPAKDARNRAARGISLRRRRSSTGAAR
jgi:hypothetical protein